MPILTRRCAVFSDTRTVTVTALLPTAAGAVIVAGARCYPATIVKATLQGQ